MLSCPFVAQASDGEAPPAIDGDPIVILLSLDGTRPEDLAASDLPTFARLRREGASAERLIPVFPSNTFPNHVSLVTGVIPERHGIVSNVFRDPERGVFRYEGDPTWLEAEPLWSILDRFGIPSASYHWVGSEGAWRNGRGPRYWKRFRSSTPEKRKVEQILGWLDLPAEDAPRLITAWFRGADHAGHRHGPGTEAVAKGLREQDAALASLLAGIEARGLWERLTLLLVSDHGMIAVEREVDLFRALRARGVSASVRGAGGFAILELLPAEREGAREVAASLDLEVIYRDEAGASHELSLDNVRYGAGVVVAAPGVAITRRAGGAAGLISDVLDQRGAHGYWPELPEMGGIFIARGRNVTRGSELGVVRALDVAPTVLDLLGVPRPAEWTGRPILEVTEVGHAHEANAGTGAGEDAEERNSK